MSDWVMQSPQAAAPGRPKQGLAPLGGVTAAGGRGAVIAQPAEALRYE